MTPLKLQPKGDRSHFLRNLDWKFRQRISVHWRAPVKLTMNTRFVTFGSNNFSFSQKVRVLPMQDVLHTVWHVISTLVIPAGRYMSCSATLCCKYSWYKVCWKRKWEHKLDCEKFSPWWYCTPHKRSACQTQHEQRDWRQIRSIELRDQQNLEQHVRLPLNTSPNWTLGGFFLWHCEKFTRFFLFGSLTFFPLTYFCT